MRITELYNHWDHNRDFDFYIMVNESDFNLWEHTVVKSENLPISAYRTEWFSKHEMVKIIPRYEDLFTVILLLDQKFEVEVFQCDDSIMTVYTRRIGGRES